MKNAKVLISGASIGGPALAYWLNRYGFEVTMVERAPFLRPGGQAVDVRGPALDVVDRMGILAELRGMNTGMRGMSMVDTTGREVFRSTEHTYTGGEIASPDVEIMRDDLCRLLYETAGDDVRYLFDDSIAALVQDDHGVRVTFEHAAPERYDVVVGADGLHSNVRKLVFGPEDRYISHLGSPLAVFTAPNFLGLDHWQVFCQGQEVSGGVMSARDNTESRVYIGFEAPEAVVAEVRGDVGKQKQLLAERLSDAGWEFPRMLTYMWEAADFHFDAMSQIHMDRWSNGRVVLLGDAGYCGSPMSGQGTSMALVGAYVLAGELMAAADHRAAFAAYEDELREYVARNQQLALTNRARVEARTRAAMSDPEAPQAVEVPDFQDFGEVVNDLTLKEYRMER
jgi:2-polyprenyl-6-methoxyphenol hydroxylase-like FAD-dependent oxidoreductase